MQRLRRAVLLARLALAWFVLALGVAATVPALGAGSLELVCSGSAIKLVAKTGDGGTVQAGHTLDCPLCVQLGAPPPAVGTHRFAAPALARPADAMASARVAARFDAPPPARGPPPRA